MKTAIMNIIHGIAGFFSTHTIAAVAIAATVTVTAVAVPVGVHLAGPPVDSDSVTSSNITETSSDIQEESADETSSVESNVSREATENESTSNEVVSDKTSNKVESVSSKPSSKPATQTSSKASTTSSKPSTTTNTSSKPSGKKDWIDYSLLTGTQADVGKVVGYTTLLGKDITVVSVVEKTRNDGLKEIETTYSFGSATSIVECEYCHGFPCPNGGGEKCSEYNAKEDASVTCQTCGKPRGNGYNGTCKNLIDWSTGTISCNYYD